MSVARVAVQGDQAWKRRLCAGVGVIKLLIQLEGREVKGEEIGEEEKEEKGEQGVP